MFTPEVHCEVVCRVMTYAYEGKVQAMVSGVEPLYASWIAGNLFVFFSSGLLKARLWTRLMS